MQIRAKASDKVSLLGQARRRFLGLSPTEASFARRGFLVGEEKARYRLEQIGVTFLSGYHAALEETGFVPLARRLTTVEADLQGFAFEGAAMGLALLDCFTPWRNNRWRTFTERFAEPHIYMMHVGLGWALARLRKIRHVALSATRPSAALARDRRLRLSRRLFRLASLHRAASDSLHMDQYERRVFDQGWAAASGL
jgi:hypothetical protein